MKFFPTHYKLIPLFRYCIFVFLAASILLPPFQSSVAAQVPQAPAVPAGSTVCGDFNQLEAGTSVEGLGTVHPALNINTTGNAVAIKENSEPFAYQGPNDAPVPNLGTVPFSGFSDVNQQHDYNFSFSSGTTINFFTLKMLDYGDRNEHFATEHEVSLTAYGMDDSVIDVDILAYTSDTALNPRTGSAGDLYLTGDAATQSGNPGNYTFAVEGSGIARLELDFSNNVVDSHSDSFFGLAVLCFELESSVEPPTGTTCANFADLEPGMSVEGLGAVHPALNISTTGNAIAIKENSEPFAYQGPNDAPIPNLGVNPLDGFFDEERLHEYSFFFNPGTTINFFTLKMLDYGDRNEHFATEHEVSLIAYGADDSVIDVDTLAYTSDTALNPRTGSAGDLYLTGDAATQSGNPGNYTFAVEGSGIARLELDFSNNVVDSHSDSFFGIAVLCFEPDEEPELDPPTAELTLLRPKRPPAIGGKFLVEYACSETAPNLVSATINGYDVVNGQDVNLVVRENESARIVNDVLIWLFAHEFSFDVTCADDNGNEVSTTIVPEFETP